MRSVGDLLVASVHNTYSVDVDHAARQVGEQLGRIELAEGFLCDQQRLPDHGRRVLHLLEPLGRGRPEPHRGERRLADAPDHTIQACHLLTLLRSDLAQAVDDAALRRHRVLREARPGLPRQFADIYVALAIDGDAVRRSELPRQDAAWCLAKPRQDLALQRMDADARPYIRPVAVALALWPALADVAEQVIPAPQAHAVWTVEVIPLCLPFAVRVEHLHAVVLAVGDVNPALGIAADVVRNVELAGIGARLAP